MSNRRIKSNHQGGAALMTMYKRRASSLRGQPNESKGQVRQRKCEETREKMEWLDAAQRRTGSVF